MALAERTPMPASERMFQVIVLGGLALTAGTALSTGGCGNTQTAFPHEGAADAAPSDAGQDVLVASPQEDASDAGQDAGFPHEGADSAPYDAGQFVPDASPQEGGSDAAAPSDAGQDAPDALPDAGPDVDNG